MLCLPTQDRFALDSAAVNATTKMKALLATFGMPAGANDKAGAEHTISAGVVMVTNRMCEPERKDILVPGG